MQLSKRTLGKIACACAMALSLSAMAGCTQPLINNSSAQEEASPVTPTEYMASVNTVSQDLKDKLTEFSDAVAAGDSFTMQARSDEAQAIIDRLNDLEAPEELAEVKDEYAKATSDLQGALVDYTALYNELVDAQGGGSFDYGAYASRVEQIQKQYDSGLNALEEADKKAAGSSEDNSGGASSGATAAGD